MELHTLLEEMQAQDATDLHLTAGLPPILRIQGELHPVRLPPATPQRHPDFLLLTEDDVADLGHQLRRAGGGAHADRSRFLIQTQPGKQTLYYLARVSLAMGAPMIWVRTIMERVPQMQELGLPPVLERLTHLKQGLIIVAGPSRSGKQTTAASMIEHVNRNRSKRIVVIEDDIGYRISSKMSLVTQHLVDIDCESVADGVTRFGSMDSDIVYLSELADQADMLGALRLAETGRLVIATLFAGGVQDALERVSDLAERHANRAMRQMSCVLEALVVQRLLHRAHGRGRVAVHEILVANDRVRERIARGDTDMTDLMADGRDQGMQTFDDAVLGLLERGAISYQTAHDNLCDLRRLPEES